MSVLSHLRQIKMHKETIDNVIAATLVASPWWAPYLAQFNELLTTISLLAGIIWIAIQMRNYFKNKKDNHDPE